MAKVQMSDAEVEKLAKEAVEDVLASRSLDAMKKVERLTAAGVSKKRIERLLEGGGK